MITINKYKLNPTAAWGEIHGDINQQVDLKNLLDTEISGVETWVNSQGFAKVSELPSLTGYATETWVNSQGFAKESDIPSLTGYATETWVNSQGFAHQSDIPSLTGYATETWVESRGYLTEHQSLDSYATREYVDNLVGVANNITLEILL